MNKQWEPERSRVEHANDARITFTIALHGDHAWEMLLEDSNSYHSISHGGQLTIRRTGKPSSRKIQERYGIAKDQARKDVDDWFKTLP